MKTLEEIKDELVVAQAFVQCACMASQSDAVTPLHAVLFDAAEKMREVIEDLEDLRGIVYQPSPVRQ